MDEQKWTTCTYRLDEITRKFPLPVVIRMAEGYYSANTDAEVFSAGDIMTIDKELTLLKVAADYAANTTSSHERCDDKREKNYLGNEEILLPLNYKGKLKVRSKIKDYENVQELSVDMPRYVKLRQNLTVKTGDGASIDLQCDSVVEVDRLIPRKKSDGTLNSDCLVLEFKQHGKPIVVAVPTTSCGKFRSEPDHNEYTIKEAIDRYKLPQIVSFVDDEIKRVYTHNLIEGIENMKTIKVTETFCLNRLVSQNVLVGHYKPVVEEKEKNKKRFLQRTLIVIPLDSPAIREIEVNVLPEVTSDIYQEVFLVRNVSHDLEIIDGTLYVDFATKPGVKRIEALQNTASSAEKNDFSDVVQPPLLPKPHYNCMDPSSGSGKKPLAVQRRSSQNDVSDEEDYIIPEPKQERTDNGACNDLNLAAVNFDLDPTIFKSSKKKIFQQLQSHIKKLGGGTDKKKQKQENKVAAISPALSKVPIIDVDSSDEELRDYDEINENNLIENIRKGDACNQSSPKTRLIQRNSSDQQTPKYHKPVKNPRVTKHITSPQEINRPVMQVAPQLIRADNKLEAIEKQFKDLTVGETEQRLNMCGMPDFATICKKEHLDGNFIIKLTDKELMQEPFNLSSFNVVKLGKVKNNWIPNIA